MKDGEATVSFFSLCFVYYPSSSTIHSTPFRSYKFPHSVSNVLPTFVTLLLKDSEIEKIKRQYEKKLQLEKSATTGLKVWVSKNV